MRKEYSGRLCAWLTAIVVLAMGTATAAFAAPGVTNQIIVQYQDSSTQAQALKQLGMAQRIERSENLSQRAGVKLNYERRVATGADVFRLETWMSDRDVEAIAAKLAASPGVVYAEPDRMWRATLTPNDSRYNEQWHYFEATGGINVETAWDTYTGSGVVVAVLDTGYRPHADLAANLVGGYDFIGNTFVANDGDGRDSSALDPGDWMNPGVCGGGFPPTFRSSSWHGTHVAGTIAAVTNNSSGVAGVAFGAKVLPVRVLGKCGGFTSDIADGIIWASGGSVSGVPANSNPAQVLNLSLGGGGSCPSTTQNAVNTARSNGATVVVSAGNSNANAANATPANCSGVVTVAAPDRNGGKAFYSNFGSVVDIAAPGGETSPSSSNGVLSTLNTGTTTPGSDAFAFYQGTSMAAPHIAGVVALMYEAVPTLTPTQAEDALENSARAFPASCSQCGAGIVDADAAIAEALNPGGGGGGGGETFVVENLSAGWFQWNRFTLDVPAGMSNLTISISDGSGDADLYVRFNAAPTTGSWDCRPYLNGNNETCSFSNPQAGTWHIGVRGFFPYSGVTLTASYSP